MGKYDDDDSDDAYGGRSYGGSSYNRNSAYNGQPASSSILKKPQQRNVKNLYLFKIIVIINLFISFY